MKAALEELVQSVSGFKPGRFIFQLDICLKNARAVDLSEKTRQQHQDAYQSLNQEAAFLLSQSRILRERIRRLRFQANGHPDPETTGLYFRKLRHHHLELVVSIAEEIEILQEMVRQNQQFQGLLAEHAPTLKKAATLMTILRDRLDNRPSSLLRLQGTGEKIAELNQTFAQIYQYEADCGQRLWAENEDRLTAQAMASYRAALGRTHELVQERTARLKALVTELKAGARLFRHLGVRGYSRRKRRALDGLIQSHQQRCQAFYDRVQEHRNRHNSL